MFIHSYTGPASKKVVHSKDVSSASPSHHRKKNVAVRKRCKAVIEPISALPTSDPPGAHHLPLLDYTFFSMLDNQNEKKEEGMLRIAKPVSYKSKVCKLKEPNV